MVERNNAWRPECPSDHVDPHPRLPRRNLSITNVYPGISYRLPNPDRWKDFINTMGSYASSEIFPITRVGCRLLPIVEVAVHSFPHLVLPKAISQNTDLNRRIYARPASSVESRSEASIRANMRVVFVDRDSGISLVIALEMVIKLPRRSS